MSEVATNSARREMGTQMSVIWKGREVSSMSEKVVKQNRDRGRKRSEEGDEEKV
jgi:hypothetical protein